MGQSAQKIESIKKKMRELENATMPDAQVKKYESAIQKAEKRLEELHEKHKNINDAVGKGFPVEQAKKYEAAIDKVKNKFISLKMELEHLESVQVPTIEYEETAKQIRKMLIDQEKLNSRMEKFKRIGGSENSKTYKSMQDEAEQLSKALEEARAAQTYLSKSGGGFIPGSETEAYAKLYSQAEKTKKELEAILDKYAQAELMYRNSLLEKGSLIVKESEEEEERLQELVEQYEQAKAQFENTADQEYDDAAKALEEEHEKLNGLCSIYQQLETEKTAAEQELLRIKEEAVISDERVVALMEEQVELQNYLNKLKEAGLTAGYQEYDNVTAELAQIKEELNETEQPAATLGDRIRSLGKPLVSIGAIGKAVVRIFVSVGSIGKAAFFAIGGAAKNAVSRLAKFVSVGAKIISFFPRMEAKGISALFGIKKHAKSAGNLITSFGKRVLGLAKTVLVFSVIRQGFNALKSSIQEGFSTYLNYDQKLNTSINNLKVSLNSLKANLGAAFAPIVSAVVPYLQTLIGWLIAAINVVSAFFAALTGQTSYKQASADISSIGDSASSAAGGLGDAADAANELNEALGDYDELSVISQDNSSSAGSSGSGGSGGSSGSSGITYTDVGIDSAISNFADELREAWQNADFTEIGAIVGEKLKNALDGIDWDGIQTISEKIGKSIATFINGAVEVSGLADSVGYTIGQGINTAIIGLDAFLGDLHWGSVGDFIADGLNNAIATIDWALAGQTIRDGLNGIFELAATWSGKFSFSELGNSVKTLINSALTDIKWENAITAASGIGEGFARALNTAITTDTLENIGSSLANAVNTVIVNASSFISNVEWSSWGKAIGSGINTFFAEFDWAGAIGSLAGLAIGLADAITGACQEIDWSDIETKIKEGFGKVDWNAVVQAMATALGAVIGSLAELIGSLIGDAVESAGAYFSNSIDECGGNIALGILNGIINGLASIGAWIKENIFQPFIDGFKSVFGIHSPSTVMEEQGGYLISGMLQGILNGIANIATWLYNNILKPILDFFADPSNAIEAGISLVKKGWTTVSGWLSSLGSAIVGTIEAGVSLVKKGWTTVKDFIGIVGDFTANIVATVKEGSGSALSAIKKAWNTITDKTATLTGKAVNATASVFTTLKSCWSTITDKVAELTGKAVNATASVFTTLKSYWSTITDKVAELSARVKEGAENKIKEFKDGLSSIVDRVVELGVSIINDAKNWWQSVVDFWTTETKSKSLEAYVEVNPGSMGEGAETPEGDANSEYTVEITGDNSKLKKTVDESAEYLNENLPNETSTDIEAEDDTVDAVSSAHESLDSIPDKVETDITASITAFDDDIANRKLAGFCAEFTESADKITAKTLKDFIAQITGQEDLVTNRELREFVASLEEVDDNLKAKTLYDFIAEIVQGEDKITQRKIQNFVAGLTSVSDEVSDSDKEVDGMTGIVEDVELPSDTLNIKASAEINEATVKDGVTLEASVNASELTNTQKKILSAVVDASDLSNTQKKKLEAAINASDLTNTQKKTLSALINASEISNNGKQ